MRGSAAAPSGGISLCAVLTAVSLSGLLLCSVALPLALSSPIPTPREGGWIVEPPPPAFASLMPIPVTVDAEDDIGPDETATPSEAILLAAVTSTTPAPAPPETAAKAAVEPHHPVDTMGEVDRYLWQVYQRTPNRRDSSGDFTWKDPAAAKRLGMTLPNYVIGGMDADFREQLYHAGRAMDAAGIRWGILSAFRDDYRQRLAAGFKARPGNSQHGGSNATGGYGHGRAVDVTSADGDADTVWQWLDAHGARYGLYRPMPGADPAHVQPRGSWHNLALALRDGRLGRAGHPREAHTRTAADRSRSVTKSLW
jgi:hypothetical protein